MKNRTAASAASETREEEAVNWFLRVERGDASVDELMKWQQWMERSPAHRATYESMQHTWLALDGVDRLPWPTDAEVIGDQDQAPSPRTERARWRPWAMAACVTAIAAGGLLWQSGLWNPRSRSDGTEIATEVAEHRQLRLPDGSQMQVGGRTDVEVDFSPRRRSIRLRSGEVFFDVGKDAARPFVVEAGASRITAIGTAFNVRRYGNLVTVEVAQGAVRLDAQDMSSTATALRPGQEATIDNGTLRAVRPVPTEQIAAWRTGQHRYIDTPLDIVIADLNRYATQPVTLQDPALGALRVTTTFFSDDCEGWLETLETAVPSLQVSKTGTAVRISQR